MSTQNTDSPLAISLHPGDLLNETEAAALFGLAIRTLRNWRALGKGPRFRKIGERLVRYRRADLLAFIAGDNDKADAA